MSALTFRKHGSPARAADDGPTTDDHHSDTTPVTNRAPAVGGASTSAVVDAAAAKNDPVASQSAKGTVAVGFVSSSTGDLPADENPKSVAVDTGACSNEPEKTVASVDQNKKTSNESTKYDDEENYEVERIINRREVDGNVEYRVKWLGFSSHENTWEPEHNLECPDQIEEFLMLKSQGDVYFSNDDDESSSVNSDQMVIDENVNSDKIVDADMNQVEEASKENSNSDKIVDKNTEQVEKASKENENLDKVVDENMDTVSNCENEYKNPDHFRDENIGKTTEVNMKASQNEVICIDLCDDDDQDENSNIIVINDSDEDQNIDMDVDEVVNVGNEEISVGNEVANLGNEEISVGNEVANLGNEEISVGNEVVNVDNEEVNVDNEKINVDNAEVNVDEEVNEDFNGDDEEDNEPLQALMRNAITGNSSIEEFDRLTEEERLLFRNSVFDERNYEGKVPRKIVGATNLSGELLFLIHWEDTDFADLVPSRIANIKWPKTVIEFYEERIAFIPPPQNE